MTRSLRQRARLDPRRVKRELRAVERWARELGRAFPERLRDDQQDHWHLPVSGNLVNPPTATPRAQVACARALIDAAARLRAVRPAGQEHVRISAIVKRPEMFMSQVCVFFCPDYFAAFAVREHPDQIWTPLPRSRSLAREWGLVVPEGFEERGFHEVMRDGDDPEGGPVFEGEIWMVTDRPPDA